jgi:rhamnulokinase
LPDAPRFAAADLGAESGRVVVGTLRDSRVDLEVVHRFANRPVRLPDGLRWNAPGLLEGILDGLRATGPVDGVGVDAWGVDYGLVDEAGRLLGLPFHHRDPRTTAMIARAFERVPREELYAATGIQTIPINTVFQLLADEGTPALAAAARVLLIPDLLALWLSGEPANEVTAASTTGLLDARTGAWALEAIERLGLPARLFGELVEPGTPLGPVLGDHDIAGAPLVRAVAGHDTASAFAAAPVDGEDSAILSSGTWSLLGLELAAPVLGPDAAAANLTNERGVDGTTRLLKNVMGLWLVQECRRTWSRTHPTHDYEELHRLAAQAPDDVPLIDPDDEAFLAPGDMPARIAAHCERSGQRPPTTPGETVRAILVSLACKYRVVLRSLERVSGRRVRCVHVIGGGARNALLCQLTADVLELPVLAGPVEATALGNVLVQARGAGLVGSLAQMRELASASARPTTFEPRADRSADYQRFLAVTGLAEHLTIPTAVKETIS